MSSYEIVLYYSTSRFRYVLENCTRQDAFNFVERQRGYEQATIRKMQNIWQNNYGEIPEKHSHKRSKITKEIRNE